jgi:hypothetical protein
MIIGEAVMRAMEKYDRFMGDGEGFGDFEEAMGDLRQAMAVLVTENMTTETAHGIVAAASSQTEA